MAATVEQANSYYGFSYYYYPFVDEKGKNRQLRLWDNIYNDYYAKGYLKDDMLEQVSKGKTVTFQKDDNQKTYIVKKVPYVTKAGKTLQIVEITADQPDDSVIINQNLEKIVSTVFDDTGHFNYNEPQRQVDRLGLNKNWRTWSTEEKLNDKNFKYANVKVYQYHVSNSDIMIYCKYSIAENKIYVLDEAEYKAEIKKYKDEEDTRNTLYLQYEKQLNDWFDEIKAKYYDDANDTIIQPDTDTFLANIQIDDNRVAGMLTSQFYTNSKRSIFKSLFCYRPYWHLNKYNLQPDAIEENKTRFLQNFKVYVEFSKKAYFRKDLWKKLETVGLEELTKDVEFDTAVNLGYFPIVKKIMTKQKENSPKYIIFEMYKEETDIPALEYKLLNLLKLYYDFQNMPEKDRRSIARFVAKNRLKEYYEEVQQFDDVLEDLMEERDKDPKLLKPMIDRITGTSKTGFIKDKSYYFEKRGRLRNTIALYKPVEFVEELRKHINEYNYSSGVAQLMNIELDADESFVFQFITLANSKDDNDFDGRRLLNLTRIYNYHNPNKRIGFVFDNINSDDEDEEQ